MQKAKILFIIDHLKGGGAEKITIDLANALADIGHKVTMAVLDGNHQRMYPNHRIECFNLAFNPIFFQGDRWRERKHKFLSDDKDKISELIKSCQPDLTILTFGYAYFVGDIIKGSVWHWVHGVNTSNLIS